MNLELGVGWWVVLLALWILVLIKVLWSFDLDLTFLTFDFGLTIHLVLHFNSETGKSWTCLLKTFIPVVTTAVMRKLSNPPWFLGPLELVG